MGPWMGDIFFPLTPALGERENRRRTPDQTRDGFCQASVRKTHAWRGCSLSRRERVRVRGNDGWTATEC